MFDLGMTELLVIGVVALIVVGPKDLPMLFRKVGQFVGKAKGMAREFSRAMDQAADDSGMKEATSSFKDMTSTKNMGLDGWDEATKDLKNWSGDPDSETGKLAAKRAEQAKKIHEVSAKNAEARLAAQAARAADAKSEAAVETAPKTAVKKAATKAVAKKPAAQKAPVKAAVKPAAKPAAKKTAAKKPATKKTAAKPAKDSE
ncbi:Sec-independent protein translocase protein TatB [Planktotalea arctica]|uniref:Sec-independent protein translocase protein TatB n=1 Tax=Planktotalea arctica TaxID=1481893 RepID=UPI000A1712B7|nr:Sec-independent protein translocase protein TatB [Planktotalea arctica]